MGVQTHVLAGDLAVKMQGIPELGEAGAHHLRQLYLKPWENYRKTIGKWWFFMGSYGIYVILPL